MLSDYKTSSPTHTNIVMMKKEEDNEAYQNFINTLQSEYTQRTYRRALRNFLTFVKLNEDDCAKLLEYDIKTIENFVRDYIWFCIEPLHKTILGIYISEERNMLVAEKFIRSLVQKYGKHTVYTDGGTWYDEACNVLGLKHYLHSPFEKSLIERVIPNSLCFLIVNFSKQIVSHIQIKSFCSEIFRDILSIKSVNDG